MVNPKRVGIPCLALVLLLTHLSIAAAVQNEQSSTTSAPVPSGLVVVMANKPQSPLDLRPFDNPYISGVALQIHWSNIEPVEGKPDWSKLDALFAAAQTSKKWVHLVIFPGFFTPSWALQGVKTEQFAIQYGPGHGTVLPLPMPWDELYLSRWFAFLSLVSARYGNAPAFRMIAADGPTSVSEEGTLPNSRSDLTKWQALGYTSSKLIGAWQKVLRVYSDDFPNQYVSLAAGPTRQAIVDDAIAALGRRFALQSNDVHAGPGPNGSNSEQEDEFVIGYNGRVITGLEMRGAAEGASRVMGAQGDPPQALRKSIDIAMKPNANGQHINYLEISKPDVIVQEMQSVLRDAASLFGTSPPVREPTTPK